MTISCATHVKNVFSNVPYWNSKMRSKTPFFSQLSSKAFILLHLSPLCTNKQEYVQQRTCKMVQFSVKLANATKTAFSTLSKEQTRMSCSIFSEMFTFQNGHFEHLQRQFYKLRFVELISSNVIKVALIKKSAKIN